MGRWRKPACRRDSRTQRIARRHSHRLSSRPSNPDLIRGSASRDPYIPVFRESRLSLRSAGMTVKCGRSQVNIESPIAGQPVSFELGEDYPELREAVRKICAKYPGAYWRDLE